MRASLNTRRHVRRRLATESTAPRNPDDDAKYLKCYGHGEDSGWIHGES